MTLETRAAFAARLGMTRQRVHQLIQEGRVVLTDDGWIDVEASLARIHDTESPLPLHEGRRQAHAEARAEAQAATTASTPEPPADSPLPDEVQRRTKLAVMRNQEAAAALKAEEHRRLIGESLDRADTVAAFQAAYAQLRDALEALADRLTPQALAAAPDAHKVHAAIADAVHDLLTEHHADVRRRIAAIEDPDRDPGTHRA